MFGTFDVSPIGAEPRAGEWVRYQFEWTVSTGVWRDLDTLELRVRQPDTADVPLWIKWDGAYEHVSGVRGARQGRR